MGTSKQAIPSERVFITIDEACRSIPASRSTVYKLLNEGRLVGRKLYGRTLIERAAFDRFCESLPGYAA